MADARGAKALLAPAIGLSGSLAESSGFAYRSGAAEPLGKDAKRRAAQ